MQLQVLNIDEVRKTFALIRERAVHPRTAMESIATVAWKDVMEHFRNEEGPDSKWAPLKPATIAARRKGRGTASDKILQDTGRLRMSNRWRTLEDEAHIYTSIGYAGVHNNDERGTGKLPQRKFLWLSDKAKGLINRMILRWIREGKITMGPAN